MNLKNYWEYEILLYLAIFDIESDWIQNSLALSPEISILNLNFNSVFVKKEMEEFLDLKSNHTLSTI